MPPMLAQDREAIYRKLQEALAGRLVQMARFRNLLVYRYWDVDPQRVLRYARENLVDFEDFLALVGRLTDTSPA